MSARSGSLRVVATVAVLGLAVQLLLPRLADLHASLAVMRSLRPWALGGALAAQVLSYCASGVMMRSIVRAGGGRLDAGRGVAITLAAGSVGLVAWGALGFAGAAYRWARDAGAGKEGARLAAWLPTVLNAAVIAAAAALGMLELLALGRLTTAEWSAFVASLSVMAGLGALLVWAARNPRRAAELAAAPRAAWARLRHRRAHGTSERDGEAGSAWAALAGRGRWSRPLAAAALATGFDLACLYLLFVAARLTPGFGVLLAGYGLPLLVGKIAVIPGGLGVVEGGMAGMYHALGVPAATAVTVVLAYRVVSFWLPNALGFVLLPWLQAGHRSAPPHPREALA
jgi:hypothetical protein